jgi:hypothetical protein
VYAYSDLLESYAGNSSFTPSHIVQVDGKNTTDFLLEWSDYGGHQDKDALWNDLFYSLAQVSQGGGGGATGSFTGNSRGSLIYPGPTTTLTFANGSEVTNENFAKVVVPMSHIQGGPDMYRKFLSPPPEAYRNAWGKLRQDSDENIDMRVPDHKISIRLSYPEEVNCAISSQRHTQTLPAVGYPSPVIRQKQNLNGGYFLEGPEFRDVAVLTVGSFHTQDRMVAQDFQKINSDFIAAALAANKTKLIIDTSANGGSTFKATISSSNCFLPYIHMALAESVLTKLSTGLVSYILPLSTTAMPTVPISTMKHSGVTTLTSTWTTESSVAGSKNMVPILKVQETILLPLSCAGTSTTHRFRSGPAVYGYQATEAAQTSLPNLSNHKISSWSLMASAPPPVLSFQSSSARKSACEPSP